MLRSKKLVGVALSTLVLLAACGANDENNNENEAAAANENVEENEEVNDEEETNNEENEEVDEQPETEVTEGEIFNTTIAEETGGDVELIYTNNDPGYINDLEGFEIAIEAYEVVKVTNITASEAPQFKGDREGYVVTAKATLKNNRDSTVYYNANIGVKLADSFDVIHSDSRTYIPEEHMLEADEGTNVYKAGTEKEFWVVSRITTDQYEEIDNNGARYVLEASAAENEDYSGPLGTEASFEFVSNPDQAQSFADTPDWYADGLTTDNLGTKELITEFPDLNITEEIEGLSLTLEGIQYVDFVPNEINEGAFVNYGDEDLVALTAKVLMENNSGETIDLNLTPFQLDVNDEEVRINSQGMVENQSVVELEDGQSAEKYVVFLFHKKYFDVYENMKIKAGPFRGEDVSLLFSEDILEFEIPKD
ncbi:DUF5068 domain-containing protein [Bacillus sp. A301a_S52]|nr:DUF5068 domain-containing protein [Bacillus sp. A301a_S52]